MIDWQPGETAPKDGTTFLAFNDSYAGAVPYAIVTWIDVGGYGRFAVDDGPGTEFRPKLWALIDAPIFDTDA